MPASYHLVLPDDIATTMVSPSAIASTAARLALKRSIRRGTVGQKVRRCMSQWMASLLSLRRTTLCASGSAILSQATAAEAGTGGMSALQRTIRPWHSITRACKGRHKAGTVLIMTPLKFTANSSCCQRRAGRLYIVPGGLRRSE